MKKILLSTVLLVASALSAADATGLWVGKGGKADPKYGVIPTTFKIGLTQAGSKITGFIIRDKHEAVNFTSGSISGNDIMISYREDTNIVTGHLTVDGVQVSGRLTSTSGEVYNFAATKQ
jgi:hypothetical protein